MPEAERLQDLDAGFPIAHLLAHQIFSGNADVGAPGFQVSRDFASGNEDHLDIVQAFDLATITARVADLAQIQSAICKDLDGLLHEPPLGRDGENQSIRRRHHTSPVKAASRRSV